MVNRDVMTICIWLMLTASALAKSVSVKYRGRVPLDTFEYAAIDRSSFIEPVCYDAAQEYMIILLKGTYYHYVRLARAQWTRF